VQVPVATGVAALVEAVRRLADEQVTVLDVALHRPTLDDVFLTLTGHAAEDADATQAAGTGAEVSS
jgi:ABC-2 type transport system ATP-binding protein